MARPSILSRCCTCKEQGRIDCKIRAAVLWLLFMGSIFFLFGCNDDGGGSTSVLQAPQSNPVYDSGDLGPIVVAGVIVDARARFTLGPDELPLAVIVEADYAPSSGNTVPAFAELVISDTRADVDPSNDVLVGALSPPFSRVTLSLDEAGSFSMRVPIAGACPEKVALCGGTWSARLRIQTAGWNGTVYSWRLRVVTVKGAEVRPASESFVRDQ